jgi:hypothetical protein
VIAKTTAMTSALTTIALWVFMIGETFLWAAMSVMDSWSHQPKLRFAVAYFESTSGLFRPVRNFDTGLFPSVVAQFKNGSGPIGTHRATFEPSCTFPAQQDVRIAHAFNPTWEGHTP